MATPGPLVVNEDSLTPGGQTTAGQASNAASSGVATAAAPGPALATLPATHITIVPSFDTSVSTSPVATRYENAVSAAIGYFESVITTPITVSIDFGWGELDGSAIQSGAVGESLSNEYPFSYSQVYQAVQAVPGQSAVQRAAYASLPANDPTNGAATIELTTAQAAALGLQSNAAGLDGWVGLDSSSTFFWSQSAPQAGGFDAVSVFEHEISEVLGRFDLAGGATTFGSANTYTLLDFFRYTAANQGAAAAPGSAAGPRDEPFMASYSANSSSYFSYSGQTVTLPYDTPAAVAAGADIADWSSSVSADPFGYANYGVVEPVSATDLQELNVIGYGVACFAEGTTILTEQGPARVEELAVGTRLPTVTGRFGRIVWIGRRTVQPRRHPRPHDVSPIRVRAGALGDGPARDLVLSPDHAVLLEGVLVPIRHLANGVSIAQETWWRITYWHVELDRHDAVFAEGLACETYLDTGNRGAFEGGTVTHLHAEFARHHTGQVRAEEVWAERACAAILTNPAAAMLRRMHTGLLGRAARARRSRSLPNPDEIPA